ncbi:ABC transporter ATP-binding protein [Streptomyces sp. NPDC045431]|uniref:ABC transporter ATP-binding protein n=1 Tax=Streptomyces sp. NPDC045431 TaxID=3155613 RepID=UPI0033EF68FE
MKPPVLRLRGVRYDLPDRPLLTGVDLTIADGESVALMGPSGSGKSTLLSCVLGLVRPDDGVVEVAGTDTTRLRQAAAARHRARNIGMVFQFGELLPELTPLENVMLAAMLAGTGRAQALPRATELLGELGIAADSTATGALSGGERQRVAIARALVNRPPLVLADEPTGALDSENRDAVGRLLYGVPTRWGCALLVVTHDQELAGGADRLVRIADGAIAEDTRPAQEAPAWRG